MRTPAMLARDLFGYGRPDRAYFFCYGANMHQDQLRARCLGHPAPLAVARLPEYRLAFYGHSKRWDGGQETIVPAPSQAVWGVVFELTFTDADRLDAWQDVRLDGSGAYFHSLVQVFDADGRPHLAFAYKKDVQGQPALPSREQLAFILQAAQCRGLPTDYVAALERLQAHPASYPVPRLARVDRAGLMTVSCKDCGGN